MRRFLREPLLHFLLLGAVLFSLYAWLHRGRITAANEIVVSRGQIESLAAQFGRVWQRPPTTTELQGLIDTWVREEIFYREGLALGLDRDDPVVRRRIGQKVEFIAGGQAPPAPTTAELQTWLDGHADRYRIDPRFTFRQIYFDPMRRADRLDGDIASAREELARGKAVASDSTMLPVRMDAAPEFEVASTFGTEFTDALKTLPVGGWRGPVRSGLGIHLVELSARDGGRPATLEEVRPAVERDLAHARTEEANVAFYRSLRANYRVRIEAKEIVTTGVARPAEAKTP